MIKQITLVDKGQALKSFCVYIGDSLSMISSTYPQWIQDAYHGKLVDVTSLKEGECVKVFSFDKNRMETTEYQIERIDTLTNNSIENGKEN